MPNASFDPEKVMQLKDRFIDRDTERGLVHDLRTSPASTVTVLAFFGDSGIGVRDLIAYVYQGDMCQWTAAMTGTAESRNGPSAYVDLPYGMVDTAWTLWDIRTQLVNSSKGVVFLRFDHLFRHWLRGSHMPIEMVLEPNRSKDRALRVIVWIVNVVSNIPLIGVPLGSVVTSILLGLWAQIALLRRLIAMRSVEPWFRQNLGPKWKNVLNNSDQKSLERLQQLLPRALAQDLIDAFPAAEHVKPRTLLLVDNYESLQDQNGIYRGKEIPTFIEHLAEELAKSEANVLVVIGAHNRLRWGEEYRSNHWILDRESIWARDTKDNNQDRFSSRFMKQQRVYDLSHQDAIDYLTAKRGVDATSAEQIYAAVGGLPFALSFTASLVRDSPEMPQHSVENYETALKRLVSHLKAYDRLSEPWCNELDAWLVKNQLDHVSKPLQELIYIASVPRWFNLDLLYSLYGHGAREHFDHLINLPLIQNQFDNGRWRYQMYGRWRTALLQDFTIAAELRNLNVKAKTWFGEQAAQTEGEEQWILWCEELYHLRRINADEAMARMDALFDQTLPNQTERRQRILNAVEPIEELSPSQQAKFHLCQVDICFKRYAPDWRRRTETFKVAALESANLAAELSEQTNHKNLQALAYLASARAYTALVQFANAIPRLKQALDAARADGDANLLAVALAELATTESTNNPDFGSVKLIDEALRLIPETVDARLHARLLRYKALLALRSGSESQTVIEVLVPQLLRLNAGQPHETAEAIQYRGEAYSQQGRWDLALADFQDASVRLNEIYDVGGMCNSNGWIGIALCYTGHEREGLDRIWQCLAVERDKLMSLEGTSKWLHAIGKYYIDVGQVERSLDPLWLAEMIRKLTNQRSVGNTTELLERARDELGPDRYSELRKSFAPEKSVFTEFVPESTRLHLDDNDG